MKGSFLIALFAALGFVSCSSISQMSSLPSQDSVTVRTLTDCVVHRHIIRPVGPWNIHAITIDLTTSELDITSARAFDSLKGRETTSSIAKRHSRDGQQVVVAMNADFFNMQTGENDLNQIIEGEIVKGVKKPLRAQFALDVSRKPHIERFRFDGVAIAGQALIAIDAVNNLRDSAIVLLNRFFRHYTRNESERAIALRTIAFSGDTMLAVVFDSLRMGNQMTIADSTYVLRAKRRAELQQIAIGDTVRLWLGFLPRTERIKTLVGGLPRIVVDGKTIVVPDSMEGVSTKFITTRHPRTGVGFSQDGTRVMFVTVDGRQAASVGMSLAEFAELMIELGCYRALNLDGGGSTTMVIEGNVVNVPSDAAGERPVANALLVVKKRNAGTSR